MRYTEAVGEERMKEEVPEKSKGAPKETPRTLAGSKDYDYSNLGSGKPMKGGNPWS